MSVLTSADRRHGYFARAVWLLDALPPSRPQRGATATKRLFLGKLRRYADAAISPPEGEEHLAAALIVVQAPVRQCIAWWVGGSGLWSNPSSATLALGAYARLADSVREDLAARNGRDPPQAVLRAAVHARMHQAFSAQAATRDTAFTEAEIRADELDAMRAGRRTGA